MGPSRRFSMPLASLVGVAIAVSAAGCSFINVAEGGTTTIGSPPYDEGSGRTATESRTVDAFHAVSASQGVVVTLTAATTPSVAVTADDNLLTHVTTDVREGTLVIGVTGSIRTNHPLDVKVAASGIDGIAAGAGATIRSEGIAGGTVKVTATSGSTIHATGRVDSLTLQADTGSTADLRDMEAASATVSVTTGSTAFVRARDSVSGNCGTGSTLHVSGGAAMQVSADTSSTVKRD